MARAVITGVAGQDGSYLAELLLEEGTEVVGIDRSPGLAQAPNIAHLEGEIEYVSCDIRDKGAICDALGAAAADEVYHLASPSFVPESWADPSETMAAIAVGTAQVIAACRRAQTQPRLWLSATAEVFGAAAESPQTETTPANPTTPYGVAKLAALGLAQVMRERQELFAVAGILYNHESPRRPERFVSRKITRAAARISLGLEKRLELGDLNAVRDWSDARDFARATVLALRAEEARDYVLASGKGRTIAEFVDAAFSAAGIPGDWRELVVVNEALVRPPDPAPLVGDYTVARETLGWEPATSFEEMVSDMVEHDLAIARDQAQGA